MKLDAFKTRGEAVKWIMENVSTCKTRSAAEAYLRSHLPDENHYQTKIMKAIKSEYPDSFVWKAVAGPYARQGIPDVCAIIDGMYYGFEVKRPYYGVPSQMQIDTIEKIKSAGGSAGIVMFPEQALAMIKEARNEKA